MPERSYPSISVVIPSLNQGQFLEETILSVIGQQYPNLELILIDGGSTDNTLEIIEKYSKQISYWHSRKDQGQGDAINQGMSMSSGDILCWLNSDDMYFPGTLLDVGKKFEGRTDECYLVYGGAVEFGHHEGRLYCAGQPSEPFDASRLTHWDFVIQPSAFWTRKLWAKVGNLDVSFRYVLDWDWFIRASKITHFEYIPRFYSLYRFHPLHKTGVGGAERRKEMAQVVKRYASDYWISLYEEVDAKWTYIISLLWRMYKLKIPKRGSILPLCFPSIYFKLRDQKDFYTVLNMYGSAQLVDFMF